MSSSTLSERDAYRVRRFDLVLEHSDGGGGYNGTGCLPCLPWCRQPMYSPGQHITGYLLIRPIRRITITGVKIYFEGLYRTEWSDKSLKWRGRRLFYTDCVHLIRGRLMDLETRWYRFDFEHVLPRNLLPSFKTPHCRIVYMATGLVTQLGATDIHSFETKFQIRGPVDVRSLPASYHQCVSQSSIRAYQFTKDSSNALRLPRLEQMASNDTNQIIDGTSPHRLNGCCCDDGHGRAVYSQEVSCGEVGEERKREEGVDGGEVASVGSDRVSMALWVNKKAFVNGEAMRLEVHIDNHTPVDMEATVQFEQLFLLKPTYAVCRRTSEYVPLGGIPTKRIHNNLATLWAGHVTPCLTETKSLAYIIPKKLLTNITPPEGITLHRSSPELYRFVGEKEPLIKIQYFVRLKVKPKAETVDSDSQRVEVLTIELKIGNCDTGAHTEDVEIITSTCGYTNRGSTALSGDITSSSRRNTRQMSGTISGMDLLDSLDGSEGEDSVFDVVTINEQREHSLENEVCQAETDTLSD